MIGWTSKQPITIVGTYINNTLTNCPVVLTGNAFASSFFATIKADGSDLRFSSDSDGLIELPREVQYIDTVSEEIIVHVKIDSLTASTNKVIYAWAGNASASEPAPRSASGAQMVWNDVLGGKSYYGVVHFQKGPDSGTLFASDPGFKSGFESSGNWTAVNNAGNIAQPLSGGPLSGQEVWELANSLNITNLEAINTQSSDGTLAHYFEIWLHHNGSYPNSNAPIFVGDFNRFLKFDSNGKVKFGDSGNASTSNSVPNNAWYQRVIQRNAAGNVEFALNGASDGVTSTTQDIENMNRIFQDRNNSGTSFDGTQIAWLRVCRGDTLGIAHLGVQYNAVVNAALFATAGTPEITPVQFTLTLTGLQLDTEVRIYRTSDNVELAGVESSTTTFVWNFDHVSDFDVYIVIHNKQYEPIRIEDYTITASNITLPIQQRFDRTYRNP